MNKKAEKQVKKQKSVKDSKDEDQKKQILIKEHGLSNNAKILMG